MPAGKGAPPRLRVDRALEFMRLIWAVDHELERVSTRMQATIGLTVPQRMCLLLIDANPGVLASEIAEILHLHRGTLSGILRRLQQAGLVSGTPDPHDRRRVGLTLTRQGRTARDRRTGTFEGAVRDLLAATRPSERRATERLLANLQVRLQRIR